MAKNKYEIGNKFVCIKDAVFFHDTIRKGYVVEVLKYTECSGEIIITTPKSNVVLSLRLLPVGLKFDEYFSHELYIAQLREEKINEILN